MYGLRSRCADCCRRCCKAALLPGKPLCAGDFQAKRFRFMFFVMEEFARVVGSRGICVGFSRIKEGVLMCRRAQA